MPLFDVRSVEWDAEDGVDITIVKVTGTIDGVGSGDVIDYRNENMAMDPDLSSASSVLSQLDDLAWQWGDEAVFARCRDRLRELVNVEKQLKCRS